MSDNIPWGVITEILGRLSWWELCRLRCVCKEWRSIIDEPSFSQRQIQRSTSLFLHLQTGHESHVSFGFEPGTFCRDRREEGPAWTSFSGVYLHGVMGSCHGLACLSDFKIQLLLVNPALPEENRHVSLERFMMRDPDLTALGYFYDSDDDEGYSPYGNEWAGYGFGDDEVAHDYKAVMLLASDIWARSPTFVLTYRFRTRSFNVCHASYNLHHSAINNQRMGVLLGGSLHWILEEDLIHSFDLGSDVFGQIQQPKYRQVPSSIVKGVGVVDSCLCVCATYGQGSTAAAGGGVDVWVMKEYGSEESWCILHSVVDNPVFDQPQLVRSLGILMLVGGGRFAWVDTRNGRVKVIVLINGLSDARTSLKLFSACKVNPKLSRARNIIRQMTTEGSRPWKQYARRNRSIKHSNLCFENIYTTRKRSFNHD